MSEVPLDGSMVRNAGTTSVANEIRVRTIRSRQIVKLKTQEFPA